MYISASAPEAPPFSDTTIGCFIRLFFWIAACIIRAIWSEAPPAPAATTISTGFVGSQAKAGALMVRAASAAVVFIQFRIWFVPVVLLEAFSNLRPLCGQWPADSSKSVRFGLRLSPQRYPLSPNLVIPGCALLGADPESRSYYLWIPGSREERAPE